MNGLEYDIVYYALCVLTAIVMVVSVFISAVLIFVNYKINSSHKYYFRLQKKDNKAVMGQIICAIEESIFMTRKQKSKLIKNIRLILTREV